MTASHVLIRLNTRKGKVSLARRDQVLVVLEDGSRIDISQFVKAHRITSSTDELRIASIDVLAFDVETFEAE